MSAAVAVSRPPPTFAPIARAIPRPVLLLPPAVMLLLPVLLGPMRVTDSHWINLVWSEQFTREVGAGTLWPRWLPASHGGLGAPVFYYYGPAAFWLAAAFGLAGAATWPSLVLAAIAALWGSGVAMERYLRGHATRPLLGAAVYMTLPYHLLDFQMRGALAEFCAYAALPLVALGIRRAGAGRVAPLAASYALLILTHLPTALLASLFLVPALLLAEHRPRPAALMRAALGLALGLALAAAYLLPALLLRDAASLATMTATPALQAARWTILSGDPRIRDGLLLVGAIGGCAIVVALGCIVRDRWSWFVIGIVALALGIASALWRIPLLAAVQFPWRLLVLADFGVALLVARASLPSARVALLVAPALILSLAILVTPSPVPAREWLAALSARHPDVIEYLPPQLGEKSGAFPRRALALADRTPAARAPDGWTVVRRFAFPAWRVRCGDRIVPSGPEPGTGLLRYRGGGCAIERHLTGPERIGMLLTLLALAGLAFQAIIARRSGWRA